MLWCWWNSICWNFVLEESRQKQRILLLISLYLCIYRFLSANFEVSLALTHLHRCWWRMFRWKSPVDFYTNFIIFKLSLPHECALRDSHAVGLIEPNAGLLMFCAFCYGWLDGTLNTQLIALIGSTVVCLKSGLQKIRTFAFLPNRACPKNPDCYVLAKQGLS